MKFVSINTYTVKTVGEKSLDLTYEIQAFTDAGIFIIFNCTMSVFL